MVFDDVFSRFIDESPVCVMFRGTLENVFSAKRLNQIFEETAERQYCRELLFSTCADSLAAVVMRSHKSVNSVYRHRREQIGVSVRALYDKLAGIETTVSERMVRDTASDLTAILSEMGATRASALARYEVRILDGNHLSATDHRIKELRDVGGAPLPGHTLAILNPQSEVIEDVITCEDGHASERSLLPRVLEKVQAGQCWIGDRNFCTFGCLWEINERGAYFIIRQHGQLPGTLTGRRRKLGRIETGVVYEQSLCLTDHDMRQFLVRRISVHLDKPTRDGDTEIHILSNLPARISGKKIARSYRDRWQIEDAFRELATTLRSEINTLGYPAAALFGFCIAVVTYNALSAVRAALRTASRKSQKKNAGDAASIRRFSAYYLAEEISGVYRGMMIAIPATHWMDAFARLTPRQMAKTLLWLAKRVDFQIFYTNPHNGQPKKPKPKSQRRQKGRHVSTHKVLLERSIARQ